MREFNQYSRVLAGRVLTEHVDRESLAVLGITLVPHRYLLELWPLAETTSVKLPVTSRF